MLFQIQFSNLLHPWNLSIAQKVLHNGKGSIDNQKVLLRTDH